LYCSLIASQTRKSHYILRTDICDYVTDKDGMENIKHIYKCFFQYSESVRLFLVQIPAFLLWKEKGKKKRKKEQFSPKQCLAI